MRNVYVLRVRVYVFWNSAVTDSIIMVSSVVEPTTKNFKCRYRGDLVGCRFGGISILSRQGEFLVLMYIHVYIIFFGFHLRYYVYTHILRLCKLGELPM